MTKLADIITYELVKAAAKTAGLPEPVTEFRFCDRLWRFDAAIIADGFKVGVEIEGGVFTNGRHTRGQGFIEDCAKYNTAAIMGWVVIRLTPDQLKKGDLVGWLKKLRGG